MAPDETVEKLTPELRAQFAERRARARAKIPVLTVIYHPQIDRVGERALLHGLTESKPALVSRLIPEFSIPGQREARPLESPYLSRTPLRLSRSTRTDGLRLTLESRGSDVLLDGLEIEDEHLISAYDLQRGVVLLLASRVVLLLHLTREAAVYKADRFGLIGESDAIVRVREEIDRVADLEVPVLLRSETGTGKELVAQAIHQSSKRQRQDFLSVNLAAVPASLATAELFGSAKGAYTGSVRNQVGYFSRAHGGTLFLDEIGDAPSEVQVLLLRVLESGEVQRVGSQEAHRVDVRLIAATDADLEAAIRSGKFREPLLHRLSGYEINVPPLRERREDIGRLLVHFLRQELRGTGEEYRLGELAHSDNPWLPASIVARLTHHPWPGNVRQLRNVARQLVVANRGSAEVRISPQIERMLREAEASLARQRAPEVTALETAAAAPRRKPSSFRKPSEVDEEELRTALRNNRWQLKPTAQQLGISRPSLYTLIERCAQVRKAVDLDRTEIMASWQSCAGDLDAMVDELEVSKSGLRMRMTGLELP